MDTGTALASDGIPIGTFFTRQAWRISARAYAEYRALTWLAITLELSYLADFTDFAYRPDPSIELVDPGAGFNKFQTWLGLRVFY